MLKYISDQVFISHFRPDLMHSNMHYVSILISLWYVIQFGSKQHKGHKENILMTLTALHSLLR